MIRIIAIVALFLSFAAQAHMGSDHSAQFLISVKSENFLSDLKSFQALDIDIAGVDKKAKIIDLLANEAQYETIIRRGHKITKDLPLSIMASIDDRYFNPLEIEEFVLDMASQFPAIARAVEIGKSVEGRSIWALKISDNVRTREHNEPTVLFNSMHHSREIMTPEVAVDMINYLLQNYVAGDAKTRHWVNNNEIWIVPMLNVDGNAKVWRGNTFWRKNTRGGYGVDLNRNYPYMWNTCNGSSGSRYSQTYRGPTAGSEPETKALMNLVSKIRPVFDISYHAYSELLIYPMGCKGQRTSNKTVVEKIGKKVAALLDYEPGTAWELLYSVDGGDIDWMYGVYQVIPYVIELNSRADGFHPDYEKRDITVKRNRPGWQYLLDRLDGAGVRGRLNLKEEEEDAVIKVFAKNGTTETLFQEYKVNDDGTFHIVLNKGQYRFELNRGMRASSRSLRIGERRVTLRF